VVAPPPVAIEGGIGQRMGPNLLAYLMGAMHPIWPSTIWCDICGCVTMLPWSWASLDAHLFRNKAQRFKVMRQ
jgi:hypothetical protein